jgi:hypothetical protein
MNADNFTTTGKLPPTGTSYPIALYQRRSDKTSWAVKLGADGQPWRAIQLKEARPFEALSLNFHADGIDAAGWNLAADFTKTAKAFPAFHAAPAQGSYDNLRNVVGVFTVK